MRLLIKSSFLLITTIVILLNISLKNYMFFSYIFIIILLLILIYKYLPSYIRDFINYLGYRRTYKMDQKVYIIPFYTKKGRAINLVHPNYLFETAIYKGESKTSPDTILVTTNLDKKVRRIPKTWVFSKFTLTLYLFNPYKLEDYVFTRK